MKKNTLSSFILMMLTVSLFAQNNITLNINHKLSDVDFAMDLASKNNIDHDFKVTRLEYYISEISIIHDAGVETTIDDLWVLVNAARSTNVDLGSHDITNVEMIKLHIGVNEEVNHNDPSAYPTGHPLAPKFPSMHWGWAPGYRFVAIEGYGGPAHNQLFQLHGLGDNNYFTTEVALNTSANNNEINISLDADYTRALENIALNNGVIIHGETLEAKECLENFRDFVFTQSTLTSSTIDISEVDKFDVYPNPSFTNSTRLLFDTDLSNHDYQLSISDINGRQIMFFDSFQNGQTINFMNNHSGVYFVNLLKEGQVAITKKLVIK